MPLPLPRLRFSLRLLLLLVALLAGWLGWQLKRQRDAKRALEAIEAKGGFVLTAERIGNTRATASRATWFDCLTGNRTAEVDSVAFPNENFSDEDVRLLKQLPSVTQLTIRGSRITDDGLREIATLPNLAWLDVSESAVTPIGVLHLGNSKSLRELYLGREHIRFSPPLGNDQNPQLKVQFVY